MDTFTYNHRVKVFPDGTIQHFISSNFQDREFKSSNKSNKKSNIERKEYDNLIRAKQAIFDIAKSNDFDYFITLTFDKNEVSNRYDYKSCCNALSVFTKHLNYKKIQYLIVPEYHEDKAYHFHGLIKGDLELSQAYNSKTGKPIKGVYNIDNFKFGHTTASKIRNKSRVSTYVTKYLTKSLISCVPKGSKRYWCSRGLNRPIVAFNTEILSPQQIFWLDTLSDYRHESHSKYGDFYLFEYHPSNSDLIQSINLNTALSVFDGVSDSDSNR